ncbi:MAG TPA: glucose 1-dehydrogenase [Gammaproteobacteria bacterium]|nr:glucose 1-dehydrogenase [Gammaproteobacteria bacterium]
MQRLKNKVALITGGSSGIGYGIAKHFHDEGAKVVIVGRDAEKLAKAKKQLGGDVLAIEGDIANTANTQKILEQAHAHFGKIDILIVNAGMGERLHIEEVTEEKFDKMVNTNYRGAYFTVKYALDYLNHPASIILIGSIAASLTIKRHSVYASTKAAIVKLAQNLSNDLAKYQIRVNSISPGYIKTPIFDNRLEINPDYLNSRAKNIPLQRIGTPEDIAKAALFLASDEASYITGTNLLVDGGYSASFAEPE